MNRKLRYYMRGLGIGIIVTALILIIAYDNAPGNKKMTDAQIKERAAELGMVEANSYSLTDALGPIAETIATEAEKEEAEKEEAEKEEAIKEVSEKEETLTENVNEEEKQLDEVVSTEENQTEVAADTEEKQVGEVVGTEEKQPEEVVTEAEVTAEEKVTIVIPRGSGSDKIARLCAEAGLVDDAAKFDLYLVKAGYSTVLRSGTFEVPVGANEEQIAKILSGRG